MNNKSLNLLFKTADSTILLALAKWYFASAICFRRFIIIRFPLVSPIKKTFMLNSPKVLSIKVKLFSLNPHIHCRVPAITFHLIPCYSRPISTLLIPLLKAKQQLFPIKIPSGTPIRHYMIFRSPTTHSTCIV